MPETAGAMHFSSMRRQILGKIFDLKASADADSAAANATVLDEYNGVTLDVVTAFRTTQQKQPQGDRRKARAVEVLDYSAALVDCESHDLLLVASYKTTTDKAGHYLDDMGTAMQYLLEKLDERVGEDYGSALDQVSRDQDGLESGDEEE